MTVQEVPKSALITSITVDCDDDNAGFGLSALPSLRIFSARCGLEDVLNVFGAVPRTWWKPNAFKLANVRF